MRLIDWILAPVAIILTLVLVPFIVSLRKK